MASPGRVLLIDDDTRMEQMFLEELRFPATRMERDPSGGRAPEAGKVSLMLLNAEFQKNFVLCRRYKKGKHTTDIPLAFFTFSHDREHLRILAEHRSLPTHADHYLMPPVTPDKVRDLIARTVGAFEPSVSRPPAPQQTQAQGAAREAMPGDDEFLDPDNDDADDDAELNPEPTADDTPALSEDGEGHTDAGAAVPLAQDDEPGDEPDDLPADLPDDRPDVPQDFAQGSAGFQSDRMSSVESYIRTLHEEFRKVQEQLAEQHQHARAERERLQDERNAAMGQVREEIDALRGRTAELEHEAVKLRAEKDRLQVELLAVESAPLASEAADAELREQAGLLEQRVRDLEAQLAVREMRAKEAEELHQAEVQRQVAEASAARERQAGVERNLIQLVDGLRLAATQIEAAIALSLDVASSVRPNDTEADEAIVDDDFEG